MCENHIFIFFFFNQKWFTLSEKLNHSFRYSKFILKIMQGKIVEIKTFSPEIYRFVCQMLQQLSPGKHLLSEAAFCAILNSDNAHLFVIKDSQDTPAGMTSVGIYRTPSGCKAWIEDVVVDITYRGQGYGKMIVEYAIDFLRHLGADSIALTTNASRVAANHLYPSLGFEKYNTNVYKINVLPLRMP